MPLPAERHGWGVGRTARSRVRVDIACVRVSVDGLRAKWFTDVVKGKPSRQPAACPKSEHADLEFIPARCSNVATAASLGKKREGKK